MLSAQQIAQRVRQNSLIIDPFFDRRLESELGSFGLQKAGYDLTYGGYFYNPSLQLELSLIGEKGRQIRYQQPWQSAETLPLKPGETYCLQTREFVKFPPDLAGVIFPKSRMARCGLLFSLAQIDPEYEGYLSITVTNPTRHTFTIVKNQPIVQMCIFEIKNS